VAVGFAIEAYEWRQTDTDTETVADAYDAATVEAHPDVEPPLEDVDVDADELAEELAETETGTGTDTDTDFPGPWEPDDGEQ
jgi:hypothetical protein